MIFKNKKILVTGGCGFVGSNLIKQLKDQNDIISIDNYISGKKSRELDGVVYYELDCKNISEIGNEFNPDIIYHLGEYSRVENSTKNPSKVFDNNLEGTYQILKFAKEKQSKIIYAGSSTKFGDNGLNKFESPYAFTKALNTELVKNYAEWNNLDYAITYFYNVYGEGENDEGEFATVIGIFKRQLIQGKPLTVVKPGGQERNFTHIDDIVKGLILVGASGYGDNYGIGSEEKFTILEVAKMFSDQIQMMPERKGNRMTSVLNCDRTKDLGWISKQSLTEHIDEFLAKNIKK